MMRLLAIAACAFLAACAAGGSTARYPGQFPANPELSADEIAARAHEAAGGEAWRRPRSLLLEGYMVMYRGAETDRYESYRMWRIYDWGKTDAHAADGKVRIEATRNGRIVFLLGFDGERTFNLDGWVDGSSVDAQWSSNFGFGAIRHALDDGWSLRRLPDDLVDGRVVHMIELLDPSGGVTRFGIDAVSFEVLYAGFDTPRGWHERRYSDYYRKPGVLWSQPGRVRLFYDGVKQNEIIWTDFTLDPPIADNLFQPPSGRD